MKFPLLNLLGAGLIAGSALAETPAPSGALARQLNDAFANVYEKVAPAVVVIDVEATSDTVAQNLPEGLDYFFRNPDGRRAPRESWPEQGSGFVISADGYILTNNHVVSHATSGSINVRLKDGRKFPAKLVGMDERSDIAVIKIDAKDLPVVDQGDSDAARVGQFAFAIGAPFDLPYTFTVGVISAKGRNNLTDVSRRGNYEEYIQTDASINPGNSGGPLCDIDGKVIGVNTLISGINRGLGFSVPINIAKDVASQLIASGHVSRPWLGIEIIGLQDNEDVQQYFPNLDKGVVVNRIEPETPAATSGLRPGDVILKVDGVEVAKGNDLQRVILSKKVGQTVQLELWRQGQISTLALQTGEQPDRATRVSNRPDNTPQRPDRRRKGPVAENTYGLILGSPANGKTGVKVGDVVPESAAAAAGMMPGDVILEVGGKAVQNNADFEAAIGGADLSRGVMLIVEREGRKTFAILKP